MRIFIFIGFVFSSITIGQTIDLKGRIIGNDLQPVKGVLVGLISTGIQDTTDAGGHFHLSGRQSVIRQNTGKKNPFVKITSGVVTVISSSPINNARLCIFSLGGVLLLDVPVYKKDRNSCIFNPAEFAGAKKLSNGIYLLQLTINASTYVGKINGFNRMNNTPITFQINPRHSKRQAVGVLSIDSMVIRKSGYISRRLLINNLSDSLEDILIGRQFSIIDSNLVDAEYSSRLDLVVCVCSAPNRLVIFKPETEDKSVFSLNKIPTCVSVSPDGEYAAVGHDAMISYVDLKERCLRDEYDLSTIADDIVLGGNGYAYSFPSLNQHTRIYCTNLTSRGEKLGGSIYQNTKAKMHPSRNYMYCARNHVTSSGIERFDVDSDSTTFGYETQQGNYDYNGDLWISEDGSRLFSKQGYVFTSDSVQNRDMLMVGKFKCTITWLTHSSRLNCVALLPNANQISFYNPTDSIAIGTVSLATMVQSDSWTSPAGKFAFFGQDGRVCTILLTGKGRLFSAYTMNDDQYPKR